MDQLAKTNILGVGITPTSYEEVVHVCDQWLAGNIPNQSIRNDFTLERVLGHDSYQQGMEDFKSWNRVLA